MRTDLIERWDMLPQGAAVLCAVSGGADSMCLLHWLQQLREERGFSLRAAHFEHGLRGEESLRDAAFVQAQCERFGVPLDTGHGNVTAYAEKNRIGTEEAARILRYAFLEETADRMGCDRIATAHNANDNAETILMNLCRGSGARGLSGIPPRRDRLIRPLLETDREEIDRYLAEYGIAHVEDSSNRDPRYTRNRFRRMVLPLLQEENPSVLKAFGRTAELLREDDACLCREAERFLAEQYDGASLPGKALLSLEPAVASRVLRALCGTGVSLERTRALLRFADSTEPGVLELPGQQVRRKHGRLFFDGRN